MKENGPKPKHAIFLLIDEQGRVGHVGVRRLDREPAWVKLWRLRSECDTALTRWFRALPGPPAERIILGSCGLHSRVAREVADMLTGWFGQKGTTNTGRGRPVGRIERGTLRCWPSRSAAGRDLGVSRWEVLHKINSGKLLDLS